MLEDINKMIEGFQECSFFIDSSSYLCRAQQTLIGTIMAIQGKVITEEDTVNLFQALHQSEISEVIFQSTEKFIEKKSLVGYLTTAQWMNKFVEELSQYLFLDCTNMMNNFIDDLLDIFITVFGAENVMVNNMDREQIYVELTKGRPEDIITQLEENRR